MSVARKLLALERMTRVERLAICRVCRGHPQAIFKQVMPGPGRSKPAPVLVGQIPEGALTHDGTSCRRCGREADVLVIERPG